MLMFLSSSAVNRREISFKYIPPSKIRNAGVAWGRAMWQPTANSPSNPDPRNQDLDLDPNVRRLAL